jgi:hypothetical protein
VSHQRFSDIATFATIRRGVLVTMSFGKSTYPRLNSRRGHVCSHLFRNEGTLGMREHSTFITPIYWWEYISQLLQKQCVQMLFENEKVNCFILLYPEREGPLDQFHTIFCLQFLFVVLCQIECLVKNWMSFLQSM